ncbi:MAG TPA: DUF6496 domain-containing protein [Thermoanaerobaculia bacterium]|nr:DUF6496 domain-containing protein [Thermoanaerobaculia bacterium]
MPEKKTLERAAKDKKEGKSASTQAGEFVHEEMDHIREGKHGAASTKQAIAIGLSKARRAGVKLSPPKKGSAATKRKAAQDSAKGASGAKKTVSRTRSKATSAALKKEGHAAASKKALSKQGKSAAAQRTASDRSAAAKKAAKTKGAEGRSAAARKAARTREREAEA